MKDLKEIMNEGLKKVAKGISLKEIEKEVEKIQSSSSSGQPSQ